MKISCSTQSLVLQRMERTPDGLPRDDVLRCEVQLPPLEALIEFDAEEVVAIRNDLREGYIYVLRKWQENPTDDNREEVSRSLREYCDRICMRYSADHLNGLVATFTKRGPSKLVNIAKNATVVGSTVTGFGAGVGLFVNVADLGNL